jgi:hypothetical protein
MRKTTQAGPDKTQDQASRKPTEQEPRWAWLISIDFKGEDRSLTQAELAILK